MSAPAPKRRVTDMALIQAVSAPNMPPDDRQLPEFVEAAMDSLGEMRERMCGRDAEEMQLHLQVTTWVTQMCMTKLQRAAEKHESDCHGAWITRLPIEIGMHILRMLPIDTQSRVAASCQSLRKWSLQLLASRTRISCADVQNMGGVSRRRLGQGAASPQAARALCANRLLGFVAQRCPDLQVINLAQTPQLHDASLVEIASRAHGLREVDVAGCAELSDLAVTAIANHCPHLRALNVNGCAAISNEAIATLASRCTLLTSLRLSGTSAGDKALQTLSLHCPLLKALDLSGCSHVSELGVQPVVRRCVHLESLDLSNCDGINDLFIGFNGLACTQLRDLRLRSCQAVTDAAVLTVAVHCKELRVLDVSMCVHLTEHSLAAVGLHCRRLGQLALDSCVGTNAATVVQLAEHLGSELLSISIRSVSAMTDDAVAAIGVHCTGLRVLDLANCPRIGDDGLVSIGFGCEQLTSLNVQSCERVTDASIVELCYGCVHLRHLNVQWCPLVTDYSLEVISELCPEIESLWVTGTDGAITETGIIEIARMCGKLRELHIRDCSTMSDSTVCIIAVSCKLLERLDLQGCIKITDASILVAAMQSPRLKVINIEGCWRVSGQMMHVARAKNPELLILTGQDSEQPLRLRAVNSGLGHSLGEAEAEPTLVENEYSAYVGVPKPTLAGGDTKPIAGGGEKHLGLEDVAAIGDDARHQLTPRLDTR